MKDVHESAQRIIDSVISTRYIPTMCEWFGYPAVNDSRKWDDDFSDFLVAIMDMFIVIDTYKYHGEEVWHAWTTYYDLLVKLPGTFWEEESARDWLENVAVELKHLGRYHPSHPRRSAPSGHRERRVRHEKQKDRVRSNDQEIRIQHDMREDRSERTERRDDRGRGGRQEYRIESERDIGMEGDEGDKQGLASMRKLSAVLEEEIEAAEDYRLFREDLISPLRDGIAVYIQNGSTRFHRCTEDSGMLTSDLLVFEVEKVLGLEAHSFDGVPLRYTKLTSQSISDPALPRHLMFGQIVCLSSDGFREELHLAKIVERDDTEENGIIGLSLLYEDGTIKKNCPYLVAEPNCYLEAYQHVLSVLKSFSKCHPLPMERYIVHGKVDVRKPLYMRFEENVEDLIDDSELLKHYTDIENQDESKGTSKEAGSKVKCKKTPTIYSESDSEDDWETPIMKPVGRVVNIEGQSHIVVDGASYEIDKMPDDFKPEKLDESQRQAVIHALTNELAIIQGPPGTGKTFIGVEIARIILQNRIRWGIIEPILVVAYTNNAIDGFAERLLKEIYSDMEKGNLQHDGPLVVRLGTKSESDYLKRSGIMRNEVVSAFPELITEKVSAEFNGAMKNMREACSRLAEASLIMHIFKRNLACYKVLAKNNIIPEKFRNEFLAWQATHCDSLGRKLDQQAVESDDAYDEVYLTEQKWDISKRGSVEKNVILLANRTKGYCQKSMGKANIAVDKVLVNECSEAQEPIVRRDRAREQLPRLMEEFRVECEAMKRARIKRHAEVVFATTTGAAKERELLMRLRCPIVFAEEAAWHAFYQLFEHVVLIGDHQQLRPSPAVYELAREYNMEVSMFERLVRNGHPYRTLQVQHRMNTDITSNIIRPYFYADVADAASVLEYPDVPGMDKRCFFWMHDEPETTPTDALSRSNTHEIAIITTYSAQQAEMREAIITHFGRTANDQPSVAVETVDSFQGK
ncbi:hypothetical protein OSTOST_07455, partial [Ostertagia ostertagi]